MTIELSDMWSNTMAVRENLITVPPDGGWGWVIVGVSFYAMVVIDVPAMGFQVIQPHLMELLGMQASHVSVIFSAYIMAMFVVGPFACGVCNRFGFRTTTIIGSLIMIIGLGASFFVNNFAEFFVLYGAVAGSGTSFILMTSSLAPGFWFESKRAIAIGLVSSASGISVFSVSLSAYISNTFGWKWCFILWAGLIVILCAVAFLLAPPPMVELEADIPLVLDGEREELDITRISTIKPLHYNIHKVQQSAEDKVRKMGLITGILLAEPVNRPSIVTTPEPVGMGRWCICCSWCQQEVGSRPLYRKDIFYEGNLTHAAEVEHTEKEIFTLSMVKLPSTKDVKQEVECQCRIPEAMTRGISEMLDFSLFKSSIFLLILGSSIFIYIVRYIPFLMIKRVNIGHMDEKTAAKLTLIMGMGSLFLRGSIGFFLYTFHNISALSAVIFLTLVGGMVLCCIPISYWLPYQMFMSFMSGALPSVIITLRSIVIIDLLGLDKLTSSTGILFFIQGFASFVGMPVAEMLNEITKTNYAGMVFSGAAYIIAGFFYVVIAIIPEHMERQASRLSI